MHVVHPSVLRVGMTQAARVMSPTFQLVIPSTPARAMSPTFQPVIPSTPLVAAMILVQPLREKLVGVGLRVRVALRVLRVLQAVGLAVKVQ